MGSLSNSGRRSANYAGLYKGLQSAAAAIWWDMDNRGTAYNTIFAATVSGLELFYRGCGFWILA